MPARATGPRSTTSKDNPEERQSEAADARTLGAEDQAAGRPLRLRAQSLLLPGRSPRAGSFPISTRSSFPSPRKLIPAKTGAGESMLQGKDLQFADYTFLKEGEKDGGY